MSTDVVTVVIAKMLQETQAWQLRQFEPVSVPCAYMRGVKLKDEGVVYHRAV